MNKMSAEDLKYMGRNAANTLAEAERIKGDSKLMKLATKEAKNMVQEHQKVVNTLNKVAKRQPTKSTSKPVTKTRPSKKK